MDQRCPKCSSRDTRRLTPILWGLVLFVVAGPALWIPGAGRALAVLLIVVSVSVLVFVISEREPRWKCRRCSHVWRDFS